ncbi:MAG: mechanosensitive ion channel family protein [Chloroflexi bacterium]|nr:mechanosensitive ion channel family protein [Chloroflexota bacterium]
MLPPFISQTNWGGPTSAAVVFIAFLIAAGIVNVILRVIINRWARRTRGTLDEELLGVVRGPLVLFIALSGLFIALLILTNLETPPYTLIAGYGDYISRAWLVVVIAEVAYLLYRLLDAALVWYIRSVAANTDTELDDRLLPPLKRLLPLVVHSLAFLMALSVLNIPISPILAGLGIGGLAVALAVQPTLANFFAGTYVVTEGELNVGDYIELQGGPAGYVVEIGWRSTKIRSMFNNLVIIPNSQMANSIVTNFYSPSPALDVLVYCGVSYDSDLALVERVTRDAAQELVDASEYAVKGEPWFGFEEFGDSNISFWVFIRATDRIGSFFLTSDLVKVIHSRLTAEGIEINYPVRKLVFPSAEPNIPAAPSSPPAPPPR